MIEFDCSKLTIRKKTHEIEIEFMGSSEFEFLIFRREFGGKWSSEFYTYSNYDKETYWTYISVDLNENEIVFSVNQKIKINLFIGPVKYKQLVKALKKMIELLGTLNVSEVGNR